MKRKFRYIIYIAVVCLIFLPSWASAPNDAPFSDELASLDTKTTDLTGKHSAQYVNLSHYSPAPNSQPQAKPIPEPAMMFILGIALISLSVIGRKMIK